MPTHAVTVTAIYWNIGIDGADAGRAALYPNPATDRIQVEGLDENSDYKIVNATGQQVMAGSGYNGEPIDISPLASGSYIFLSGDQAILFVKK